MIHGGQCLTSERSDVRTRSDQVDLKGFRKAQIVARVVGERRKERVVQVEGREVV